MLLRSRDVVLTAAALLAFTVGVAPRAAATSDPSAIDWYLRTSLTPGPPTGAVSYGWNECTPVRGDWDGDGDDSIGVYCGGTWYLRNSATPGAPELTIQYGTPDYRPVVGDWDGDGDDTIGVVVGTTWHLRDRNTPGWPDRSFDYGSPSDLFVTGDWDGDGDDSVGVYVDGWWHLRNSTTAGWPDRSVGYGTRNYLPVPGDWDGDGDDDLGVVEGDTWHLRATTTAGPPTTSVAYGTRAYAMTPGDWDGDGDDDLGAVRIPYGARISTVTTEALGASWHLGCPLGASELRTILLLHRLPDGRAAWGRLVVHRDHAGAIAAAFAALYEAGFPIARMVPVSAYGGDDGASMAANNTSAFNCRATTGGSRFSEHSYGWAVDVNPVQNPYVRGDVVLPEAGRHYLDRQPSPGLISAGDAVVQAFASIGWHWGGSWSSPDYQHFSATGR